MKNKSNILSISKYQIIVTILQSVKVLQQVLQNFKSIAINIAKFQKYYNKYCKSSKVLQYLLQNLKVLH